jgi:isopenicillin N synthase-like dioxygenase
MTDLVPVFDLAAWKASRGSERRHQAGVVDDALRTSGFLLLRDHGVDEALAVAVRDSARAFFSLPLAAKQRYVARVIGRGWVPPGVQSNSYALGVAAPPDLKETFSAGYDEAGNGTIQEANQWPVEVPLLRSALDENRSSAWSLASDLFVLFAEALDLPPDTFTRHASRTAAAINLNRYPSRREIGDPLPGQFRIGAHSDFGVVTVLDRQPGLGGLQIQGRDGEWTDAPRVDGSLTVNIGDLLSHWTRGRWRSTVHRVLPPSTLAPEEELLSIVSFFGIVPETVVEALPVDGPLDPPPIQAGAYILAKMRSIDLQSAGDELGHDSSA